MYVGKPSFTLVIIPDIKARFYQISVDHSWLMKLQLTLTALWAGGSGVRFWLILCVTCVRSLVRLEFVSEIKFLAWWLLWQSPPCSNSNCKMRDRQAFLKQELCTDSLFSDWETWCGIFPLCPRLFGKSNMLRLNLYVYTLSMFSNIFVVATQSPIGDIFFSSPPPPPLLCPCLYKKMC